MINFGSYKFEIRKFAWTEGKPQRTQGTQGSFGILLAAISVFFAVQTAAKDISAADQARFIDTIEVELRGLHEGNIARYRLRPSEFTKWKSDQPK